MGYLIHLCFHLHLIKPTKAEQTLKVRGETTLDNVVFWFNRTDQQVKSHQSPLSLWDEQHGVRMMPNQLCSLCEVELPSMGVGWPPEGTMDLNIVKAVYTIVTREQGHLDLAGKALLSPV